MTQRLHSHIGELLGTTTSFVGVVTANQEQIEWYLRVTGSVVAIAAGVLTIRSLMRRK